jgi:hypothetical protein
MSFSRRCPPSNFYVYLYLRKDGTPYYCGKGTGTRAWAPHRIYVPSNDRIAIIAHNLLEEEAFLLEKNLITQYGRKDLGTGLLHNMTEGGEGSSGRITEEIKKNKISKVKTGKPNKGAGWNKGIKYTKEIKQKLDMSGLEKGRGWNKGLKLSNSHRENLKKAWEKRRLAHQNIS